MMGRSTVATAATAPPTLSSLRNLSDPSTDAKFAAETLASLRHISYRDEGAFLSLCLSHDGDGWDSASAGGGIGASVAVSGALSALRLHPVSSSVHRLALGALSDLAYPPVNAGTVSCRREEIVDASISSMASFRESAAVQAGGCSAIANVLAARAAAGGVAVSPLQALPPDVAKRAGATVASALAIHGSDPSVCESACAALRRILLERADGGATAARGGAACDDDDEYRTQSYQSLLQAVSVAMARHPGLPDLQAHGIGAILETVRSSPSRGEVAAFDLLASSVASGEGGGAETAAAATTTTPFSVVALAIDSHGAQDLPLTLGGLEILVATVDSGEKRPDIADAVDLGIVKAAVSALRSHPRNVSVQEMGCRLMGKLAVGGGPDARGIIIGWGGGTILEVVVSALGERRPEGRSARRSACRALRRILSSAPSRSCGGESYIPKASSSAAAAVGEAGGVAALLGAVRSHPNDGALLEDACASLWCLISSHGDNGLRLRREGDAPTVLYEAAHRFPLQCGRAAKGALTEM